MDPKLKAVLIGAALSAVGALVGYLPQVLPQLKGMGIWGAFAAFAIPVVLNAVRKYLQEQQDANPSK